MFSHDQKPIKMKIEAHIICWNEAETIALTAKHYKSFCERVIFYDNFSDDNTRDIVRDHGCEAQVFGIAGELNDHEYLKVKNHCWKGSDADWVIVCDADEILIPEFAYFKENAPTIIRTQGFSMFSNKLPVNDWREVSTGIQDDNYSKLICFNPKAIKEIGYVYGCHEAKPQGEVRFSQHTAKLLHYKAVGGAERLADRHALYASRLSQINKRFKLGHQYEEPRQKTIEYFNENLKKCIKLF